MRTTITLASAWAAATLCLLAFTVPSWSGEAVTPAPSSPPTGPPAAISSVAASSGIHVGQRAPDFTLKDTDGKEQSLSAYLAQGKAVVLEWFNPDCPFVKHHHLTNQTMSDVEKAFRSRGVVWLAVNSGAPGNQGAGLERNRKAKREYKISYPIVLDESGTVGRAYGAKTTPRMFVIGKDGTVIYAGAIDSDKELKGAGKTNYVERALTQHLAGEAVAMAQTTSYGCSVKYAKSTTAM